LGKTLLKRERNITMNCWAEAVSSYLRFQAIAASLLALTAISALSASTYSCGGDAGLFGKGGEEGALVISGFGAGLKYLFSPVGWGMMSASTSSSLVGGEEREELSERDISMQL
jgi:hypothetical protein